MCQPERFSREWVLKLATRYSYVDDAVATQAGARAVRQGFYSRDDFLAIVRWKSARSTPLAQRNSTSDIATATCASIQLTKPAGCDR